MQEVQVAHTCDDQGLERACGEALDDTSSEEVVVVDLGLADGSSDNADKS